MLSSKFSHLSRLQNNDAIVQDSSVGFQTGNEVSKTITYQSLPPFEIRSITPSPGKTFYTQNDTIKFEFPPDLFLDPSSVRLHFQFRVAGTFSASVFGCTTYDINTIFQRMQVLYGTQTLQDCQRHDIYTRIMGNFFNNPISSSHFRGAFDGTHNVSRIENSGGTSRQTTAGMERNQYLAGVGPTSASVSPFQIPKNYVTSIGVGLFLQNRIIPLPLMSQKLSLLLEISPAERVVCISNTAATVTSALRIEIGKIRIEYIGYRQTPEILTYERHLGPKRFVFLAYDHFTSPLDRSQRTQYFKFQINRKKVKYAFAVIRAEDDEVPSRDSYTFHWSLNAFQGVVEKSTALNNYQWKVNQVYIPEQPVKMISPRLDGNEPFGVESETQQTPATDAYTYIERTLLSDQRNHLYGGPTALEGHFGGVDNANPSAPLFNPTTPYTMTGGQVNRFSGGSVCMVGKFSHVLPTGDVCALECCHRDDIQLRLEFNGIDTAPNTFRMLLETFFVYESQVTLNTDQTGFCYESVVET